MNDVYKVVSENWGGERSVRCVLAASEEDARQAHQVHYPGEQIVEVRQ